jgi:uncharacterized protein (AIM24 family)
MQTRIQGTTMPVLEVQLDPNESVFSESGELSWMTQSIQMTTHTQMGGGGGLLGVFKRVAGGGSLFMTEYRAWQYPGEVAFATKVPGHIVPIQVGQGYEYMVHRHGFLCATPQVAISVGFQQSLGAGIFGGEGFVLQKIGGYGTAWMEISGEVVIKDLQPGEMLRVHPGHVGPGRVWLQTLPLSRLAHKIGEYLPHGRREVPSAAGAGVIGGIVGSILSGGE